MPKIIKVHVFRCVGKIDGRVHYRFNVVAANHKHAERTCNRIITPRIENLDEYTHARPQWQCKVVKMDNPIYMEWEDGE